MIDIRLQWITSSHTHDIPWLIKTTNQRVADGSAHWIGYFGLENRVGQRPQKRNALQWTIHDVQDSGISSSFDKLKQGFCSLFLSYSLPPFPHLLQHLSFNDFCIKWKNFFHHSWVGIKLCVCVYVWIKSLGFKFVVSSAIDLETTYRSQWRIRSLTTYFCSFTFRYFVPGTKMGGSHRKFCFQVHLTDNLYLIFGFLHLLKLIPLPILSKAGILETYYWEYYNCSVIHGFLFSCL